MSAVFSLTAISGVLELSSHPFDDHRGSFLNIFRSNHPAFVDVWGERKVAQVNLSRTDAIGTVRGLHLQAAPYVEAKMVRCLRGRVWDVAVDLRLGSPTYCCWHAVELSASASNALLIPEGCAHGFQVLEPRSELLYLHSGNWIPHADTGVRFDDPTIDITWPLMPINLSNRDLTLPFLH